MLICPAWAPLDNPTAVVLRDRLKHNREVSAAASTGTVGRVDQNVSLVWSIAVIVWVKPRGYRFGAHIGDLKQ